MLSRKLLVCSLLISVFYSTLGCTGGMTTHSSEGSMNASEKKFGTDTLGDSNGLVSGNGDGYGGKLRGKYYALTDKVNCEKASNSESPVAVKSVLEIYEDKNSLKSLICSNDETKNIPDQKIFAAWYDSRIAVLDSGEVFERFDTPPKPEEQGYIEIFCRGKQLSEYDQYSYIYRRGARGFKPPTEDQSLWVDLTIRSFPKPFRYMASYGPKDYKGEMVYESISYNGSKSIRTIKDIEFFGHDNEYFGFRDDLQLDIDRNAEGEFFEGILTARVDYKRMRAEMICTKGVK